MIADAELARTVEDLVRSGNEGLAHELKWDVDVENTARQIEFIRDMVSLANADPGNPAARYLVLNAQKGQCNPQAEALEVDDATFQQIVNGRVSPDIRFAKRGPVPTRFGDVAVLVVENAYDFPHVVEKAIHEGTETLLAGECLTRTGSGKRPALARDHREMEAARAEQGIGPAGVPSAEGLAKTRAAELVPRLGRAVQAGEMQTAIVAARRVARDAVRVWAGTDGSRDEERVRDAAEGLTAACDWLTIAGVVGADHGELELVRASVGGLRDAYALAGLKNLGWPGATECNVSMWVPLLTVCPRVYALGAYCVASGRIEAARTVCEVTLVPHDAIEKRPRRLVARPLTPMDWPWLEEFKEYVSFVEDDLVAGELVRRAGEPAACLCQFDLMAFVFTPSAEWEARAFTRHFPSFLAYGFPKVEPLVKKALEEPGLFAAAGVTRPVRAMFEVLGLLEPKVGTIRLVPEYPNAWLFERFRERLGAYLEAEGGAG